MTLFSIIDPPITPYSSEEEIRAWIDELNSMDDSEEKALALADAERILQRTIEQAS